MSTKAKLTEIKAASEAKEKASKAVLTARMAALASMTKVTVAAAGVAAVLKRPDATLGSLRAAHAELRGSLTDYKSLAAKAVATSRLPK
jgi:hypothetical protein